MLSGTWLFSSTKTVESYVDLVVAKALLHLVEQAAVGQLTQGRQVVIGSWRHQLNLRKVLGEGLNQHAYTKIYSLRHFALIYKM